MRPVNLACLLLFIAHNAFAQTTIYKTWAFDRFELLKLTPKKAEVDFSERERWYFRPITHDSTFILRQYFYSGLFRKKHTDYVFRMKKLTANTFVLDPLNENALFWFGYDRPPILFRDVQSLHEQNIYFQKICFSQFGGISGNPPIEMEIDSTGTLYFAWKDVFGANKNFFKGKLTDEQLNQLTTILKRSFLTDLSTDFGYLRDAPELSTTLWHDNETKTMLGSDAPAILIELVDFLNSVYKSTKLEKIANYQFGHNLAK